MSYTGGIDPAFIPKVKAHYTIRPTVVMALSTGIPFASDRNGDGARITHSFSQMVFPFILFLDTFNDEDTTYGSRSLAEDQFDIFNTIERTVSGFGFNGKSCLLRTVCEMQHHKMAKNTMLGQLFSVLLTPQRSSTDHLHDYVEAEDLGRTNTTSSSCAEMYQGCPVSLFNMFRKPPDTDNPHLHDNTV